MVIVECDAYLGDPVYPLLWIRNGSAISPDSNNQKHLTIINIDYEDEGIYHCAFNVFGEPIIANILVTVMPLQGKCPLSCRYTNPASSME